MTPAQRSKQTEELYRLLVDKEGIDESNITWNEVSTLVRIAGRVGKRNEDACNYGLTPRQEANDKRDEAAALAIVARFGKGYTLYFNGDPRGYAAYIRGLASGDFNSWGGREHGWGIG
jgi:hypothetical protein